MTAPEPSQQAKPEPPRTYLYRCTTNSLVEHLDRISESGDVVLWPVFMGGRDWILICRKGGKVPRYEITGEAMARVEAAVERGAKDGIRDANRSAAARARAGGH